MHFLADSIPNINGIFASAFPIAAHIGLGGIGLNRTLWSDCVGWVRGWLGG